MSNHEVRVMRSAILELIIPRSLARLTTGERLDIERVTSRSERGHWKRANSLVTRWCPTLPILNLDDAMMERFAELHSSLRKQGQLIPDFDLLLAATALVHDLTVLTFNVRHFNRIPNLRLYSAK